MDKLSAVIITFNEEANIGRCIDSLGKVADEIIVLDSYSTDNTVAIARSKNARVEQQPFTGYIEQKNKALALANHDFVLCLDADEALDDKLQQSIITAKKSLSFDGYSMNRCTFYCEQFIRYGLWYPDTKLRLFDKRKAQWGGDNPHDKIMFHENHRSRHLKGDILHYSYHSIEEHVDQNNKFSTISANTYYQKGKTTNLFKIIIHPVWSFLLGYIFRLGFLDGFYGFVVAFNIAHLTFLKHTKLYRLQKQKGK